MNDLAYLAEKKFAVLFCEESEDKDDAWHLLTGVAKWRDGSLYVHRGMDLPEFLVPKETLDRVKPTKPEMRETVNGAEFFTVLKIGPLPEDMDPAELFHTGLRLPRS